MNTLLIIVMVGVWLQLSVATISSNITNIGLKQAKAFAIYGSLYVFIAQYLVGKFL